MKGLVFAGRVGKELRRDPLSYIFCLGFPIVMLLVMSLVDKSIPAEAGMTVFRIYNLGPAIAYFGLTFVMLFSAIQVSKDRTTALLLRLYASPMKALDYAVGYTLPVLVLGLVQVAVCLASAFVVGLVSGYVFSIPKLLLSLILLIPSLLLFTGIGLLFGTVVSEKAAPGLCSIIISAVGMVGGIWMDIDGIGGVIKSVATVLPFYHGVQLARLPFSDRYEGLGINLLWTLGFGLVAYILSMVVFTARMKKDVK